MLACRRWMFDAAFLTLVISWHCEERRTMKWSLWGKEGSAVGYTGDHVDWLPVKWKKNDEMVALGKGGKRCRLHRRSRWLIACQVASCVINSVAWPEIDMFPATARVPGTRTRATIGWLWAVLGCTWRARDSPAWAKLRKVGAGTSEWKQARCGCLLRTRNATEWHCHSTHITKSYLDSNRVTKRYINRIRK